MRIIFKTILVLTIILSLTSCTPSLSRKLLKGAEIAPSNPIKSVVPFALDEHPIFIKVHINGSKKTYKFILDTGAFTTITKQVAKELKLQNLTDFTVHGAGGHSKKTNLVKLKSITVGSSKVENIAVSIIDVPEYFGKNIDGFLGSDFLRFFQVTIDYKNKKLTLTQDTQTISTQDNAIKIPFESDISHIYKPIVQCTINGNIKANGFIDTGSSGLASLSLETMKKLDAFKRGDMLSATGGMSAGFLGASNESYILRVDSLRLGSMELKNIPAGSHQAKGIDVLLGNKFLSKYLVTIDYPAKLLVLRPYKKVVFETNRESYGMGLTKKDKKFFVAGVWDNSPAYKAGIEPGAEIIRVNSKNVYSLSFHELNKIRDEKANVIDIVYIQNNTKHKARLHKAKLLPPL